MLCSIPGIVSLVKPEIVSRAGCSQCFISLQNNAEFKYLETCSAAGSGGDVLAVPWVWGRRYDRVGCPRSVLLGPVCSSGVLGDVCV